MAEGWAARGGRAGRRQPGVYRFFGWVVVIIGRELLQTIIASTSDLANAVPSAKLVGFHYHQIPISEWPKKMHGCCC